MGRRAEKRLKKMRQNSRDWHIEDVQALCRSYEIECDPPPGGGSHWTVGHHSQFEQPGVANDKPIKPFYIRRLVSFVDKVQTWRAENE